MANLLLIHRTHMVFKWETHHMNLGFHRNILDGTLSDQSVWLENRMPTTAGYAMNRTCTSIGTGLALTLVWSISICCSYEAAAFMTIPTPMRSSGMGEAGVADDFDPGNAFYNPAVVSTLHGI